MFSPMWPDIGLCMMKSLHNQYKPLSMSNSQPEVRHCLLCIWMIFHAQNCSERVCLVDMGSVYVWVCSNPMQLRAFKQPSWKKKKKSCPPLKESMTIISPSEYAALFKVKEISPNQPEILSTVVISKIVPYHLPLFPIDTKNESLPQVCTTISKSRLTDNTSRVWKFAPFFLPDLWANALDFF